MPLDETLAVDDTLHVEAHEALHARHNELEAFDPADKADTAHAHAGAYSALGHAHAHGDTTGLTTGDPHTQYPAKALYSAKGVILVATAASTPAARTVGANGTVLTADSAEADGVKWAAPGGGGGGPTYVYKTANQDSATFSTTLADDTHLAFTAVANGLYAFEAFLVARSAIATPDLKFQWVHPDATFRMLLSSNAASVAHVVNIFHTAGSAVLQLSGSDNPEVLSFRGVLTIGATGGTFKLQWAQNTSSGTVTTLEKGSWLSYLKLN